MDYEDMKSGYREIGTTSARCNCSSTHTDTSLESRQQLLTAWNNLDEQRVAGRLEVLQDVAEFGAVVRG